MYRHFTLENHTGTGTCNNVFCANLVRTSLLYEAQRCDRQDCIMKNLGKRPIFRKNARTLDRGLKEVTRSGASIPQQPWRPKLTSPPTFPPPHPHNFWTFYTQFCAILYVFTVNFGRWQSGIMTPKMKKIYINGVGKTYCICKLKIKRNRASVARRKIFLRKW